ncbi:MAG: hypothetical protein OXL96_00970 [Candidatus Poribacteria bacterium]|nr:hypothetical protein [Candidatus Poribacteria bacterium]
MLSLFFLGYASSDWQLPNGAIARLGKGIFSYHDRAIVFSPDGQSLAVASSIGVWLYDVTTSRELALLTGHTASLNSVSFSPDGKRLASGSSDGTILFWDMSPYITSQPPTPDFDGDGTIGFGDFLEFVALFGLNQDDEGYEAQFDLDGDGMIGFSDFLIFANAFGKKPS